MGTGVLGIGYALVGAALVLGVDAGPGALAIAQADIEEAGVEKTAGLLLSGVSSLPVHTRTGQFHCGAVIAIPPLGTCN
jgi:predicted RNA methylase